MYTLLLGLLAALSLVSCDKQEIETYHANRSLFFERWKQTSATARERIDTVGYSFSHYVGETELTHEFQIKLIGCTSQRRDRKSTRLNSSHEIPSRMPSSA